MAGVDAARTIATMPSATAHLHDFGTGQTEPQLFACSDGVDRVLKLQGIAPGSSLASDWVGSLLAVALQVHTPAPVLVDVDEVAIATLPRAQRDRARPGVAFATTYVRTSSTVIGLSTITACPNHAELLSRLLILDMWIGTEDRMNPDFGRNLLVDNVDGTRSLMAIDFGMAFAPVLFKMVGAQPDAAHISFRFPPEIRPLLAREHVRSAISDAEAITQAALVRYASTTPSDWIGDETKSALVSFLMARQPHLRATVSQVLGLSV